jgi:hypothetical protein
VSHEHSPYTGQEVGHCPKENSEEQEQYADKASPFRPIPSFALPSQVTMLLR